VNSSGRIAPIGDRRSQLIGRIVVHGGGGFGVNQRRIGFDNRIVCSFNRLRHARQPHQIALVNKTG
jgi:hypothetical protein